MQGNTAGTGDNTNALAAANQATQGVLSRTGAVSVSGAVGALISGAGAQAQRVSTRAQTAQTAVNTQAQTNVQSITGVNLDEEAANLLAMAAGPTRLPRRRCRSPTACFPAS